MDISLRTYLDLQNIECNFEILSSIPKMQEKWLVHL